MVKELDKYIQELADISAIIVDRAISPEKVVGQAWLMSKGRAVTLASSVFHYADAPWALMLKFPYPDLVFSVKSVTLHPDFSKKDARSNYLSTGSYLKPVFNVFESDIATVTLEPELSPIPPEKAAELNRALSLPLNISAQDMSGVMRPGEAGVVLQQALASGQSGLITMLDIRNNPFARVQIRQGRIIRAIYKDLTNELGLCELVWQKPAGNFVMQLTENFNWGNIAEINVPTDQLGMEANRRSQELPALIEKLGGNDARYERKDAQLDTTKFGQGQRWMAEQVWMALDGYLPLSLISSRAPLDTYSVAKTLTELVAAGLVSQVAVEPFHKSYVLGNPLVPGNDLDVNIGDKLSAFYLDPLSFAPCYAAGTFSGAKGIANNKSLLHTINLPPAANKHGALIVKENRIIGVHNGTYQVKQSDSSAQGQQFGHMTWIGNMSASPATKRLRTSEIATSETEGDTIPDEMFAGPRGVTSPRPRMTGEQTISGNYGPMDLPAEEPVKPSPFSFLSKLSKKQKLIGFSAIMFFGVILFFFILLSGPMPEEENPNGIKTNATFNEPEEDSKEAAKIAANIAGFGRKAPKDFHYQAVMDDPLLEKHQIDPENPEAYDPTADVDTIDEKNSFELISKKLNQRLIFMLWGNTAPLDNIEFFARNKTLPVLNWEKTDQKNVLKRGKSDRLVWFAGRFLKPIQKKEETGDATVESIAFVGAFPSPKPGKCVFVLGLPYTGEGNLDFGLANMIVEQLAAEAMGDNSDEEKPEEKLATAEEIGAYRESVEKALQAHFKMPGKYDKKNAASIVIEVNENGDLTRIEGKGADDALAEALKKAIDLAKPYKAPPKTKEKSLAMSISVVQGKIAVEEP